MQATTPPRRFHRTKIRAGLVIPPQHWPLIAAGIDVRPRYRVTDPDTGELVVRQPRVRRVPAVSGSTRVLSVRMLDRHARAVSRQARAAIAYGLPAEWQALVMYVLDRDRPAGARRADARRNVALVAAVLAAGADFRTGRHSMPGRQVTAALAGLSERTVTRAYGLLVRLGLLRLGAPGRWLSAGERAEIDADPEQRNRWRDRAEWMLLVPAWVRQVHDVELAPWLDRARAVLALVVDPDTPVGQDHTVPAAGCRTVPPPSGSYLVEYLPVVRSKFSQQAATARRRQLGRSRPVSRPGGRAGKGAASRPASTRVSRTTGNRGIPSEAAALAHQMLADRRFPWLADTEWWKVARTVQRLAKACWTVDDVAEHIEASGWSFPHVIEYPLAFLAARLRDADPARPPATFRRAAEQARAEQQYAHRAQQRTERQARAEQTAPANAEYRRVRNQIAGDRRAAATSSAASPPAVPERIAGAVLSGRSSAAIHAAAIERARREQEPRDRVTRCRRSSGNS